MQRQQKESEMWAYTHGPHFKGGPLDFTILLAPVGLHMVVTVQLKTEDSCHCIFIMHQRLLLPPCPSTVHVRVT